MASGSMYKKHLTEDHSVTENDFLPFIFEIIASQSESTESDSDPNEKEEEFAVESSEMSEGHLKKLVERAKGNLTIPYFYWASTPPPKYKCFPLL